MSQLPDQVSLLPPRPRPFPWLENVLFGIAGVLALGVFTLSFAGWIGL